MGRLLDCFLTHPGAPFLEALGAPQSPDNPGNDHGDPIAQEENERDTVGENATEGRCGPTEVVPVNRSGDDPAEEEPNDSENVKELGEVATGLDPCPPPLQDQNQRSEEGDEDGGNRSELQEL